MSSHSKRHGFTLTHLLVVVVIIGIILAVVVPNFISTQNRAKEDRMKHDCHTVQLAAEEYAVRHDAVYPNNLVDLMVFLPEGKMLKNAFTGKLSEPVLGKAEKLGQVGYAPIMQDGICVGYTITGYGKNNMTFTLLSGQ